MSEHRGCGLLEGKVLFVAGVGPLIGSATAILAARERGAGGGGGA